jgi:hypothetical protein
MKTNRKEGSSLFVVVIIATALGLGVYSTLDFVQGQFRANHKATVFHEGKQAVETIIQASLADLKSRFDQQTAFPIDTLSPSNKPLYISDEFVKRFSANDSGSHLVIPTKTKYTSLSDFNSQSTEVIGGQIPPGNWQYIDPRIPGNENDKLVGTRVFNRSIEMVAKATVDRPSVGTSTVYARQILNVRDAPLFAYAIFYNLPMEIAPGPEMNIYGPVHVNADAWVQSNKGLFFHQKYTSGGRLFHGRHSDSGKNTNNGPVGFKNSEGDMVSMRKDNSWPSTTADDFSGTWLTSHAGNFADIADQIYDGNVQTQEHGVLPQNPVGVTEYVEDLDPTTDQKESFNSAYNMIQPVLNQSELALPDPAVDPVEYKRIKNLIEIEKQKYSYKAGLTVEVRDNGSLRYFTYERGPIQYDSSGNPLDKMRPLLYDSSGNPRKVELAPSEEIARYSGTYKEDDGDVERGMFEKRQNKELRTISLKIDELKDLVHSNSSDDWGGGKGRTPENWWNGIVYVDFPTQNSVSDRDDFVNPAKTGWGLKVVDAETIPNPEFAHDDDIYGMALATNQMMYVQGHFNADGDFSTGSPTQPDDPENFGKQGHEAPAALVADSINFLSTDWDDEDSSKALDSRRADHTEVSAAILTGLVPSGETGSANYSGGVENFPRFLEDWKKRELVIRGSIVALFESEVGTRGWGYSGVYRAPRREWGFHKKFAEGFLPPGTPNTRDYLATDFKLLTESEYLEHVERIKGYF